MKLSTILYLALTISLGIFAASTAYTSSWKPNYESQSASQKLAYLWSQIVADKSVGHSATVSERFYMTRPEWTGGMSFARVGNHVSDQLPSDIVKGIHAVGVTCKGKFNWNDNKAGLTGSFRKGGADNVIARMSSATDPKSGKVPNIAFKILRNGAPSGNFFGSRGVEGQESFSWFEYGMCNHVHRPIVDFSKQGMKMAILQQIFKKAGEGNEANMLGVAEVANVDVNGKTESKINSPWAVCIQPTQEIHNRFGSVKKLDSDGVNFGGLKGIKNGTKLYEVYAILRPQDSGKVTQDNVVHIGEFVVTADCTSSKFADEKLFFKHTYWNDELKITGNTENWKDYRGMWTKDEGIEKYEPFFKKEHKLSVRIRRRELKSRKRLN